MGKENDAMLEYLEDDERFADIFNGGCGALLAIKEEGREEGRESGFTLFVKLSQDDRMDDWLLAVQDKEYRDRLLKEYGLI